MSQHLIPYAGQTAQPHLTPEAKAVRGGWTEERIAKLKELWSEGLSASQIGALFGVSRNSIIGKLHRHRLRLAGTGARTQGQHHPRPRRTLPRRPKAEVYARAVAKAEAPKPPVTPTKRVEVVEPVSKRLTIYELTDHICHWPHGDTLPYDYCGRLAIEGKPYCPYHAGVAYQAVSIAEANRRVARAANWR